MVNTVALLSVTGLIGSHILAELSKLHAQGEIKLIVLHRPRSNVSAVPAEIEHRPLDISKANEADVHAALRGVDILISTVHGVTFRSEKRFLKYLASANLRTYIPSDYEIPWYKREEAFEANQLLFDKAELNGIAEQLRLPLCIVRNGVIEDYFFLPGFLGVKVKDNVLNLYGGALEHSIPVTSAGFLARGIAELVQRDPSSLASSIHTIVELEVTGNEVAAAMEKVNGAPPAVVPWTEAQQKEMLTASSEFGVPTAEARRKWSEGAWNIVGRLEPPGERRTIYNMVREAKRRY